MKTGRLDATLGAQHVGGSAVAQRQQRQDMGFTGPDVIVPTRSFATRPHPIR